jgi:hypothetical protein
LVYLIATVAVVGLFALPIVRIIGIAGPGIRFLGTTAHGYATIRAGLVI